MTGVVNKIPKKGTAEWREYWISRHLIQNMETIYLQWPSDDSVLKGLMLADINKRREAMGFRVRPDGWTGQGFED